MKRTRKGGKKRQSRGKKTKKQKGIHDRALQKANNRKKTTTE